MKILYFVFILYSVLSFTHNTKNIELNKQQKPTFLSKIQVQKLVNKGHFKHLNLKVHVGERGKINSYYSFGVVKMGNYHFYLKENVQFFDFLEITLIKGKNKQDSKIFKFSRFRNGMSRQKIDLYVSQHTSRIIAILSNSKYLNKVICFDLLR